MVDGSGGETLPLDRRGRRTVRAAFAVLLFLAALRVSWDLLPALAWAVVIVTASWPIYGRLERAVSPNGPSTIAAFGFTVAVALLIFVPISLAFQQFAEFREPAGQWIAQAQQSGIPVPVWVEKAPIAGEYVTGLWKNQLADPKAAASLLAGLKTDTTSGWLQALGGNLLHRMFLFAIALVATFFLFRDGRWLGERALDTADRLLGGPGENLGRKMVGAMRGTVNGTVLVAVAEGVLIGVGYIVAGVPKPFVFIVLTTAFAMLPFGAWAAFTAAAVLLVAQGGSEFAGAAVFAWGAFVMVVGDHFVWPTLVGGAARLPFVWALVGIFGGLGAFGLVGLFLGPVIMAATITVWREWLAIRS